MYTYAYTHESKSWVSFCIYFLVTQRLEELCGIPPGGNSSIRKGDTLSCLLTLASRTTGLWSDLCLQQAGENQTMVGSMHFINALSETMPPVAKHPLYTQGYY